MAFDYPEGLTLWHPLTGTVTVTRHAWNRFLERYLVSQSPPKNATQNYFTERLLVTYLRATNAEIDDRERAWRILKHGGTDAYILFEPSSRLRFVVAKFERVLITVALHE